MISARQVSKIYTRGVHALRDFTLEVEKGEFVFLTGPSGAGKSTFLRLLLCQEKPSSGELVVAGRTLAQLSPGDVQAYRRTVGFVFQDFKLVPTRTVYENVAMVLRATGVPERVERRRAMQVLQGVGLHHREAAFPLELSGGEQQRVAVARALAIEPLVLLADEPTGNLDSANGRQVTALLRGLVDQLQQTIVMVTHDAAVAASADRLVQLRDGLVVNDGPSSSAAVPPGRRFQEEPTP